MDPNLSMSQPSTSQSHSRSQVFVDSTGAPLPIFVDSNGISDNRPKLIRTLRGHGANICTDVSLARIILVEPNSSEGRQFVRDWGSDPGKVILEVAWVNRCLEAGRALLENDAWGGCGNLDGTPLEDDEIHDQEVDLFSDRRVVLLNGRESHSSATAAQPKTQNGVNSSEGRRSSLVPTPLPSPLERGASHMNALVAQNSGSSLPQPLPTPPLTSAPRQYPPPPPQSQQLPPTMPPNVPPNVMPPFGQLVPQPSFPMNTVTPQTLQAFMANNPEAQQMIMNMMMMQGMQMAGHGLFAPGGWPGQPPQGFMQVPQGFQMMQPLQTQPSVSMPPPEMNGQHVGTPTDARGPSPPSTVEQGGPRRSSSPLPTFTAINDSDSESPVPDQSILLQRGKKRPRESPGISSSKPVKRSRSPSVSSNKKHEKKRTSLSAENTVSGHDAVNKNRPPPKGIFTSKHGGPMTFYVQVQLRNRKDVLDQIKHNGGKISTELATSDFIILDTRPGKERDQWMKVVNDLKRFALRAGFVEACINSKGIVEEDDFIIELGKKPKSTSSPRRRKREASIESEERSTPPASQSSHQNRNADSQSPLPPLGSEAMSFGGRTPFTPEEIDYAFKLAEYLLHKNPDLANSQIATELGKRAPRHSAASWGFQIYKNFRTKLDRVREEVLTEKRNGSVVAAASGGSEPEVEEQLTQPIEPEPPVVVDASGRGEPNGGSEDNVARDSPAEQSKLHEADLKTIVHFFANPPEGIVEDEALWTAITEMHKCHTTPTWQDFYAANQEVVNRLLREALDIPAPKESTTTSS